MDSNPQLDTCSSSSALSMPKLPLKERTKKLPSTRRSLIVHSIGRKRESRVSCDTTSNPSSQCNDSMCGEIITTQTSLNMKVPIEQDLSKVLGYNAEEDFNKILQYNSQSNFDVALSNESLLDDAMQCHNSLNGGSSHSQSGRTTGRFASSSKVRRSSLGSIRNANSIVESNEPSLQYNNNSRKGEVRSSIQPRRNSVGPSNLQNSTSSHSVRKTDFLQEAIAKAQFSSIKGKFRSLTQRRSNSVDRATRHDARSNNLIPCSDSSDEFSTQSSSKRSKIRRGRPRRRNNRETAISNDMMNNGSEEFSQSNHNVVTSNGSLLGDPTQCHNSLECGSSHSQSGRATGGFASSRKVRRSSIGSIHNSDMNAESDEASLQYNKNSKTSEIGSHSVQRTDFLQETPVKAQFSSIKGKFRSLRQRRPNSVDRATRQDAMSNNPIPWSESSDEFSTQSRSKRGIIRKGRTRRRNNLDMAISRNTMSNDNENCESVMDGSTRSSCSKKGNARRLLLRRLNSFNLGSTNSNNLMSNNSVHSNASADEALAHTKSNSDEGMPETKSNPFPQIRSFRQRRRNSIGSAIRHNAMNDDSSHRDDSFGCETCEIPSSIRTRATTQNKLYSNSTQCETDLDGVVATTESKNSESRSMRKSRRHSIGSASNYNSTSTISTQNKYNFDEMVAEPKDPRKGNRRQRRNSIGSVNSFVATINDSTYFNNASDWVKATKESSSSSITSATTTETSNISAAPKRYQVPEVEENVDYQSGDDDEVRTRSSSNAILCGRSSEILNALNELEAMDASHSDSETRNKATPRLGRWKSLKRRDRSMRSRSDESESSFRNMPGDNTDTRSSMCRSMSSTDTRSSMCRSMSSTELRQQRRSSKLFGRSSRLSINERRMRFRQKSTKSAKSAMLDVQDEEDVKGSSLHHIWFNKMALVIYFDLFLAVTCGKLWLLFILPSLFLVKLVEVITKWLEFHRETKTVSERAKKTLSFRLSNFVKPWQNFCGEGNMSKAKYLRVVSTAYACRSMSESLSVASIRKKACEANQMLIKDIDDKIKDYALN